MLTGRNGPLALDLTHVSMSAAATNAREPPIKNVREPDRLDERVLRALIRVTCQRRQRIPYKESCLSITH